MPSTRINGQNIDFTISTEKDGTVSSYTIAGEGAPSLHQTLSERGIAEITDLLNGKFTVTHAALTCNTTDSTFGKILAQRLQSTAQQQAQIL